MSQEMSLEEAQRLMAMSKKQRQNKYGSKRVEIDGHKFPSRKQAKRYLELKAMISSGTISIQRVLAEYGRWMEVTFKLYGKNGTHVFSYRADYLYHEGDKLVVEDVKGFRPYEYKLKKKLFLDNYPEIEFRES